MDDRWFRLGDRGRYPPKTMNSFFILHHEYEWCNRDEIKLLGVYATEPDAQAAMLRLREQPGFRDWPDGFTITEYEVGVDHWTEGFITDVPILIASRTDSNVYHIAGSNWRPGDLYEITDISNPEDATFSVGDVVKCVERAVPDHGEKSLVASQVLDNGG